MWAYAEDDAVKFDPLCARTHTADLPMDNRGMIQRSEWQVYQCSSCHCVTHAVKEIAGAVTAGTATERSAQLRTPQLRKVALIANWMMSPRMVDDVTPSPTP
jgi:hypothetical protein